MLMKRATRLFVRRQANWFNAEDPNIHWFRVTTDTADEIEKTIRKFLTLSLHFNNFIKPIGKKPARRSCQN